MNEIFNNPEEVTAFPKSGEFAAGLEQYLKTLLEEREPEILRVLEGISQVVETVGAGIRTVAQSFPPEMIQTLLWASTASFKDYQRLWKVLAGHGWFPDPSMLLGAGFILQQIESEPCVAGRLMTDLFREKLSSIECELVGLYPNRRQLLTEGFEAHRRGDYGLSILMFLAQADGISHDNLKKPVFLKAGRDSLISVPTPQERDEILASFLPLFREGHLPLWVSEKHRDGSFRGFNRHMVMHGESLDYNTEENSLKAISFLSWLAVVFEFLSRSGEDDG